MLEGDGWIRVLCEAGDLLTIPENKAFRMTTTPKVKINIFIKEEHNFVEFHQDEKVLQGRRMRRRYLKSLISKCNSHNFLLFL